MDKHQGSYRQQSDRQFNFPGLFGGQGNLFPWQGYGQGNFPGQGQGYFPGQGQGGPGAPGVGSSGGPPTSPPPSFTPTAQQTQGGFQTYAIDAGAIRGCLFQFTYIWLRREEFWFFPVYIGRQSIAGYRWNGRRWVYYGIDLDRIQSFQCY